MITVVKHFGNLTSQTECLEQYCQYTNQTLQLSKLLIVQSHTGPACFVVVVGYCTNHVAINTVTSSF